MDYIRKKRWVRYQHLKCKMYLRNDFGFECAYCRMRERDTGNLLEDYFEKDHFMAKNGKTGALLDEYENLIYACAKCNGTKSNKDVYLLLDPCKDNIYSGSDPHVTNLGKSGKYQLIGNTREGRQYIESLQLNSKFYRELRQRQEQADKGNQELGKLLDDISDYTDVSDDLIHKLETLVRDHYMFPAEMPQDISYRCGRSKAGKAFQEVFGILDELSFSYELLFDEHDIDIKLQMNEKEYLCEIILNDEAEKPVRNIRVKKEQRENWDLKECRYGVLYYYMKMGSLEFFSIGGEDECRTCLKDCFVMSDK